jgi:hypothetical protein
VALSERSCGKGGDRVRRRRSTNETIDRRRGLQMIASIGKEEEGREREGRRRGDAKENENLIQYVEPLYLLFGCIILYVYLSRTRCFKYRMYYLPFIDAAKTSKIFVAHEQLYFIHIERGYFIRRHIEQISTRDGKIYLYIFAAI